ncbi:MAG TPA: hypothetical protein VGR35_15525 [Tepidisphaeraceae bacterium]|nr:hypothetical protein [Tepidisphaeraceae bacterium]
MGDPTHAVAGWMHLARGDFRIDPGEPPLWKFLAARPNAGVALPVDAHADLWSRVLDDASESPAFARAVLYGTEGGAAAADAVLARSRMVMIAIAVALGAMIGWWAWKVGGPLAAVVAVSLFSLDPNFLAHAALLDSDMAMSLALLATVYAAWRAGRRASMLRILTLALLAGITLSLKFSGLFALLIVAAVVVARVFVPASWPLLERWLRRWWGRYVMAGIVLIIMLSVSAAALWATYGFRFRPAPESAATMNMSGIVAEVGLTEARLASRGNRRLATQPVKEPSLITKAALYADAKRLLPQAWIYGFLDTYQQMLTRPAYMLGQTRRGGWWSYFPFAIAVKTPLATLVALGLMAWVLFAAWRRLGTPGEGGAWTITCLALPVVLYLFFAMLARLDFGLRHVLPVYPFLFVSIGVSAALASQRWRASKWIIALLVIALAAETVRAYPHYVPFFNTAARALPGGPVQLLGESNIDLGQDLPLLAQWQREHSDRKLFVSYFGPVDPALYGISAVDLRKQGLDLGTSWPDMPGAVLAVSATHLQGFAIEPEARSLYAQLRKREPLAILGGSIYLFELEPPK